MRSILFAVITLDMRKIKNRRDGRGNQMIQYQQGRACALKALMGMGFLLWSANSLAQSGNGTTLKVTNDTANPVPVMVTLGIGNFGITNINQLPWHIKSQPAGSATQGLFLLPAHGSVSFNSGSKSFSGNIAFGPTFTARGQGNSAPNACYPNATNLAEFTINQPGETVDISRVNGANAKMAINFDGAPAWNDGAGGNAKVVRIADILPITRWTSPEGVYGWQATDCVDVKLPVPNGPPSNLAPAPVNAPGSPQLQAKAQCNIQRPGNVPTSGTVQIVYSGWDADAVPRCMIADK